MQSDKPRSGNLILGVTGGIATGKSAVAAMLQSRGAVIVDFDRLARTVVEPGKPAHAEIEAFFGSAVLLADGTLDREKLSRIVFNDPEKRRKLESFTHPRIRREYLSRVESSLEGRSGVIVAAVVPLLFETGMQQLFDRILLVYLAEPEQVRRLVLRDAISESRARQILAAQLPTDEKKRLADYLIDNSGPLEQTERQVQELWQELVSRLEPLAPSD